MWHDNETTRDLIGFQRFAETIAGLVTNEAVLPVTVGLFGDWGSGKSSMLRMIEKELSGVNGVVSLRFDGWLFEGYDDAKAALMTSIVERIAEYASVQEGVLEKVLEKVSSLVRSINWVRLIGLAGNNVISLTGQMDGEAGALLAAMGFLASSIPVLAAQDDARGATDDSVGAEDLHKTIREFRSEFASLIEETQIHSLVVLIDDLDRCLPESIVATLEAIKLFLSVPRTAFVIAADQRIVRQAIVHRYPQATAEQPELAQDYLDKLVQVPCALPGMDAVETETYVYLLLAEELLTAEQFQALYETVCANRANPELVQPLNYGIAEDCLQDAASRLETDFGIAARVAPILARHLEGNPRLVKRFLNTLSLRSMIADAEGIDLDRGTMARLMVLERFHEERFRELYRWQGAQEGFSSEIVSLEDSVRGNSAQLSEDLRTWVDDAEVREWLEMEPTLTETNLVPYFHLARESVGVKGAGARRLSPEQQEMLGKLLSTSETVRGRAAERVGSRPWEEIVGIYDALWSRVQANPRAREALAGLFELAYRNLEAGKRLVAGLGTQQETTLDADVVPRLARIRQEHEELCGEVEGQVQKWTRSQNQRLANAAKSVLQTMMRGK